MGEGRSPRPRWPVVAGILAVVLLALAHAGEIRARAAAGLGEGMPAREAALARGFVLGADEGIDAATEEDFRRSGLSHLLAVSGENVTLLCLLALPVLGLLGIPLRERLLWLLGLIAVYVPLAGAGPSIQRAAVMGAAGLAATLAGRRASRLHALALAAAVTLAVAPGVAGDVGWQLSFAAVLGILLLATPLREGLAARLGTGRWRRALAEGVAVTVAATLATAPLIAFHFEELSTTSLVANVLALPAVAPAMWLGMVSAAASQVPGLPLAPLNGLDALLLAYIAQVARWCAAPGWAELHVHLGLGGLIASYAGAASRLRRGARHAIARARAPRRARLAADPVAPLFDRGWRRSARRPRRRAAGGGRRGAGGRWRCSRPTHSRPARSPRRDPGNCGSTCSTSARATRSCCDPARRRRCWSTAARPATGSRASSPRSASSGSAPRSSPTTSPTTPPGSRSCWDGCRSRAWSSPGSAAGRSRGPAPPAPPRSGSRPGAVLRSGRLRLRVLWPPPELLGRPLGGADPNTQALVMLARWNGFAMLLTADAEAEAVPLDPGPVDVLKVAHHGSDDAGLAALLARSRPRLAVISVGAGNPYGHPTAATLATLAAHGVPVLRTDRDGTVEIAVRRGRIAVDSG